MANATRCPRLQQPFDTTHRGLNPSEFGRVVGLVRQPRQRLLSKCASRHREHSAAFLGCARSTVANGHLGVMTHMLIGEDVPNKIGPLASLTPANVSDALRVVLHGFAVIGLLEEWDASLRLLHATLMPAVPISESERLNVHPSNASVESSPEVPRRPCEASRHYDEGRSVFDRRLADALTLDPDQIVYAEARRVFCRSYAQRVLGCDGDACDSAQLPLSCRAPCVLTQLPAATTVDALVAKWRLPHPYVQELLSGAPLIGAVATPSVGTVPVVRGHWQTLPVHIERALAERPAIQHRIVHMTSAQPYSIESYTSDGSRPSVSFWVITNDGNPDAGRAMRATWLRSERDVHLCVANATPHAHEPGIEALPVRVPWSPAYVRRPAPRPRIRNRFLRSKVYAILLRMCASSSEFSMLLDDDTAVNTTRLYQWLHLWNLPNRSRLLFEGNRSQPSDSNVLYGWAHELWKKKRRRRPWYLVQRRGARAPLHARVPGQLPATSRHVASRQQVWRR